VILDEVELLLLNFLRLIAICTEKKYSAFSEVMNKYIGKSDNKLLKGNIFMLEIFILWKEMRFIEAST
jgi:hypothetical protein